MAIDIHLEGAVHEDGFVFEELFCRLIQLESSYRIICSRADRRSDHNSGACVGVVGDEGDVGAFFDFEPGGRSAVLR